MYQEKPDLFSPYKGSQPYIFISYSHKNSDEVMDIISKLQQLEFRIWYDMGIDPGTEWDENIASHIMECAYFIAFISDEYLSSSNCKDELNFARDKDKPRLLVYLKDTKLPEGMGMRLNRLQAIHKYTYKRDLDFYQKIIEADGIGVCRAVQNAKAPNVSGSFNTVRTACERPAVNQAANRSETEKPKKNKRALILLIILIMAIIASLAAIFIVIKLSDDNFYKHSGNSYNNSGYNSSVDISENTNSGSEDSFFVPPETSAVSETSETSAASEAPAETSYTENVSEAVGDPTLIGYETFGNIQNGGMETVTPDGIRFIVDYSGHSINYYLNDNDSGEILFSDDSKYYSNLIACDDGLYYAANGRIEFCDFDTYGPVEELQDFQGDDIQFYVADDYYFIYVNGILHRVSKATGKSEQSIMVNSPNQFAICGEYLYYISHTSTTGRCITQAKLTDFRAEVDRLYWENNDKGDLYIDSITSDGYFIYIIGRDYQAPYYAGVHIFYDGFNEKVFYSDISDITAGFMDNEKYSISGFNALDVYFSLLLKSESGKEGFIFCRCEITDDDEQIVDRMQDFIPNKGNSVYLSYSGDYINFDYYDSEDKMVQSLCYEE